MFVFNNVEVSDGEARQIIYNYAPNDKIRKIFNIFIEELGVRKVWDVSGKCAYAILRQKSGEKINPALLFAAIIGEPNEAWLRALKRVSELNGKSKLVELLQQISRNGA